MGFAVASGEGAATAPLLVEVDGDGFILGAGKEGESTIMEKGLRGGWPVNSATSIPAGGVNDGEPTIDGGVETEGVSTGVETLGDDRSRLFTGVAVSETGVSLRPAAERDTLNLDTGVFVESGGSFFELLSKPRAAAVALDFGLPCPSGGR